MSKSLKILSNKCSYLCSMNIIVVDDENLNLGIVFSLLATFGIFPIVCNNGEQAFKIF